MDEQVFQQLKDAVFSRQTTLAEIYGCCGGQALESYVNAWQLSRPSHPATLFAEQVQPLLRQAYPDKFAESVISQFRLRPLVSTIDHHGIINHQFFINSNVIFSLLQSQKYLFCLPTAGVSLNNSSWPGCLSLTLDGRQQRLSFFNDKLKTRAVLAVPPIGRMNVDKVLASLSHLKGLPPESKQRLEVLIEELFFDSSIFALPDFVSQASRLSTALWSKVFPSAPKLVYSPLEAVANRLLENLVLPDSSHLLHQLFFTAHGWQLLNKYFSGSAGGFGQGHKGSFLFWGLDSHGHRQSLALAAGQIVGPDLTLAPDPEIFLSLIRSGRLYPGSLVCFLLLLYYNITCLGGFNQVNWLTDIKDRLLRLTEELGQNILVEQLKILATDNFAEGRLVFAQDLKGAIYQPTALDLFLSGGENFSQFAGLAKSLTLADSIDVQLPEIYRVITPGPERSKKLLDISELQIMNHIGLKNKLR